MNRLTPLETIAEIRTGYTPRREKDVQGSVQHRLLQGRDIAASGKVDVESLQIIHVAKRLESYELRKDDILLVSRGESRKAIVIQETLNNVVASSTFYIVRVKSNKAVSAYIAWWMNQEPAQRYFQQCAGGTKIPFLNKIALANMSLPLPSIETQLKIASISELERRESELLHRLADLRSTVINTTCLQVVHPIG